MGVTCQVSEVDNDFFTLAFTLEEIEVTKIIIIL
jgi:hypothetical protein